MHVLTMMVMIRVALIVTQMHEFGSCLNTQKLVYANEMMSLWPAFLACLSVEPPYALRKLRLATLEPHRDRGQVSTGRSPRSTPNRAPRPFVAVSAG
jgi:hypothetical protein